MLAASLAHVPAALQLLATPQAPEQLTMNDRYFFGLLERMMGDVQRQPEGKQRDELLAKLEAIKSDADQAAASSHAA